jgi:glyoxylase-like metal-dependent hydrolase (beta-lactamase superfamily II)
MKLLTLLVCLLVSFSAQAQDNDIEIVKIRDGIHMLINPEGGNITASTGEDGTFIIDDNLEGRGPNITNAVKNLNGQSVKFILNTHYHFDHTGTNESFGGEGAIIVAHDNVRKRLSERQFISFFNKEMPALEKPGLPVITFNEGLNLHYNGDEVQIIHLPGAHTDGDAAAFFKNANVIVAGDIIFNGMYPFIDAQHGGSIKGMLAAQDALLNIADDNTAIIPGHGPLMNKTDLKAYRDALAEITGNIETAIRNGQTLEETLAAKPTAKFDEKLGGGFITPDVFVAFLYEHLNR